MVASRRSIYHPAIFLSQLPLPTTVRAHSPLYDAPTSFRARHRGTFGRTLWSLFQKTMSNNYFNLKPILWLRTLTQCWSALERKLLPLSLQSTLYHICRQAFDNYDVVQGLLLTNTNRMMMNGPKSHEIVFIKSYKAFSTGPHLNYARSFLWTVARRRFFEVKLEKLITILQTHTVPSQGKGFPRRCKKV